MNRYLLLSVVVFLSLTSRLDAQTLYVDAEKGNDRADGTLAHPVASLAKAVDLAKRSAHPAPVTIKIAPGLYTLTQGLKIEPRGPDDTLQYTFEAMIMPDDTNWLPVKMPVIQSQAENNSRFHFDHSIGFEVLRNNVAFKGLKLVGNPNPSVLFYYPIERDSNRLTNLEVSQCYFIGDRNSSPIQGALYVQGAGVHMDRCIVYGCKYGILIFEHIRDFALTHSILYGIYGAAVWYGDLHEADAPFVFHDNIVADCNYFWGNVHAGDHPDFLFSNSLITGNEHYLGGTDSVGLVPFDGDDHHRETGIRRSGTVLLKEITHKTVPRDYLHVAANSDGKDIPAGVLKKTAL